MYDHACRLVHYEQIIVLINDIERYVLCSNLGFKARMVAHERHHIAWFDAIITLYGTVIDMYTTSLCCTLNSCTAGVAQVFHQELIHTQQRLPLVGYHAAVLIESAVSA